MLHLRTKIILIFSETGNTNDKVSNIVYLFDIKTMFWFKLTVFNSLWNNVNIAVILFSTMPIIL